jgi:anti-sigma regulatory factor (Ser/Thr protein kinase)
MKLYESVLINEEAHIGQALRAIRRRAIDIGFNDRQLAEIEIAVKEIGSNAVKFARGTGRVFFTEADEALEAVGLEITYFDKGPGIEDIEEAVEDGYTTTSSMGAGLGAIKRMADEFHIYSQVESHTRRLPVYGRTTHGTAIVFKKRLWTEESGPPQSSSTVWGAFTRPSDGQGDNGDAYFVKRVGDRLLLAVIDGLGHGAGAREAALGAVGSIDKHVSAPVEVIIRATHEALRPTRGAVLGLAAIDLLTGEIEYGGIGNTDFRALGLTGTLRFISLNGTVGSRLERVKVFSDRLPKVATIVMTTDGISERWDPDRYPGLIGLHPQLLCAAVMRDFSRPTDDATILCGRLRF